MAATSIAVGISPSPGPEAFADAAAQAAGDLAGSCDLCVVFANKPHHGRLEPILSAIHRYLAPRHLIGCGAGGVVGRGREIESGPGVAVWAASLPGVEVSTHHLRTSSLGDGELRLSGIPDPERLGEVLLVLADPHSFRVEALLAYANATRPGVPLLGGLASATAPGSAALIRGGETLDGGAVACSISGGKVVPLVSQGAGPVGPEMTITAATGPHGESPEDAARRIGGVGVIEELAGRPALERLREAIGSLESHERALAARGLMLGIVIDENRPEYERGDFLVRPIIGSDPDAGSLAVSEPVRVGQTVRLHVRDGASADRDLRETLRLQSLALGPAGTAGALLFTCNGRGSHMFDAPDHDAAAIEDLLGAPTAGCFCAGEIGPVGGRNFLHGFTATMAVFAAPS